MFINEELIDMCYIAKKFFAMVFFISKKRTVNFGHALCSVGVHTRPIGNN